MSGFQASLFSFLDISFLNAQSCTKAKESDDLHPNLLQRLPFGNLIPNKLPIQRRHPTIQRKVPISRPLQQDPIHMRRRFPPLETSVQEYGGWEEEDFACALVFLVILV